MKKTKNTIMPLKANRSTVFILIGEPGVGKTTIVKKLIPLLSGIGMKTAGSYNEDVINNGRREGVNVVTVDGIRGRLAREQSLLSTPAEVVDGRYGVLVSEFESVVLPTLNKVDDPRLCLIVDQLGSMEYECVQFVNRIKEIFKSKYECIWLVTVPMNNSFVVAYLKNRTTAKVWEVTAENRDTVHEDIMVEITASVKS